MTYDSDNSSRESEQEPKMKYGPDWMWIGYMNSFDDESDDDGGGGCGRLNEMPSIFLLATDLSSVFS